MVETSDLMSGDYILVKGKPKKVIEVKRGLIGYYPTSVSQRLSYTYPYLCSPIEITDDWLLGHWFLFHKPQPGYDYPFKNKVLTIWLHEQLGTMTVRVRVKWSVGGGETLLISSGVPATVSCLHQILKASGHEAIFASIMNKEVRSK